MGLTQETLARKTKVSRRQIVYWEKGEEKPSADRLPIIADALGVTLEWLLTGKGLQLKEAQALLDVVEGSRKHFSKTPHQDNLSPDLKRLLIKLQTLDEASRLKIEAYIDGILDGRAGRNVEEQRRIG